MEATELRIGNYVFLKSKKKNWEILEGYEIDLGCDAEEFEPIPLTEEILMENNFIVDDCKGFNASDDDYYKVYSFNGFDIALIEEAFYVWHELEDSYCNFYIYNKIEFVHQLQNSYFTNKGEELEVNL